MRSLANDGSGSGGADFGSQETRTSGGLSSTGAHATAEINLTGAGAGFLRPAPARFPWPGRPDGRPGQILSAAPGAAGAPAVAAACGPDGGRLWIRGCRSGPGFSRRPGRDFGCSASGRGRGGGGCGCICIAHNKFNLIVTVVSMQPAVSSARDVPAGRNRQNTQTRLVFGGKGRFFEADKGSARALVQLLHKRPVLVQG